MPLQWLCINGETPFEKGPISAENGPFSNEKSPISSENGPFSKPP